MTTEIVPNPGHGWLSATLPDHIAPPEVDQPPGLSRRGFLRGAAVAGGGLVAAGLAACTTGAAPGWTFGPGVTAGTAPLPSGTANASHDHASPSASSAASAVTPSPSASGGASPSASIPPGWAEHDVEAKAAVDRFLAGEWKTLPNYGNQPLEPAIEGGTKVFKLTI